ncbi:MAG: twin-arginine translocase subunit TatA [Alteromonadaceae bacterium]|nr:MAG: twin-arginine translocase subunit TatA [Alteromonadaceae bacterium]
MGIGGMSPWSLVLILVIVLALFGTKRLRGIGGDLGSALKGFKKAMKDDDKAAEDPKQVESSEGETENVAQKTQENVQTK